MLPKNSTLFSRFFDLKKWKVEKNLFPIFLFYSTFHWLLKPQKNFFFLILLKKNQICTILLVFRFSCSFSHHHSVSQLPPYPPLPLSRSLSLLTVEVLQAACSSHYCQPEPYGNIPAEVFWLTWSRVIRRWCGERKRRRQLIWHDEMEQYAGVLVNLWHVIISVSSAVFAKIFAVGISDKIIEWTRYADDRRDRGLINK